MEKRIQNLKNDVTELAELHLLKRLKGEISQEFKDFGELEAQLNDIYGTVPSDHLLHAQKKTEALSLIATSWAEPEDEPFDTYAEEYARKLDLLIKKLPEKVTVEQASDRFKLLPDDKWYMKFLKIFKIFGFKVFSELPRKTANIFRKTPRSIRYWNHKIPYRNIVSFYIQGRLISEIYDIRDSLYIPLARAYTNLKYWEEHLSESSEKSNYSEELKKELNKARRDVKKKVHTQVEASLTAIENDIRKVGTLELSANKFREKETNHKVENAHNLWKKEDKGWQRTFNTFFEEWTSDLEIERLILLTSSYFNEFKLKQASNIEDLISPELKDFEKFVFDSLELVSQNQGELASALKKRNFQAKKELDEIIIPRLLEKLGNMNVINTITFLEVSMNEALQELKGKRKTPKEPTNYLEPLENTDITTTSPYELITFEIAPQFKDELDVVKSKLIHKLNEVTTHAQDLDHTVSFGITTAIQELTSGKANAEQTTQLVTESLNRVRQRLTDIREDLHASMSQAIEDIEEAIKEYNTSLKGLTVDENAKKTRLRILKAKTLQQTEEYKTELKDSVFKWFRTSLVFSQKYITRSKIFVSHLADRFILTSSETQVSKQVSDFLAESQKAIDNLPVIYRNLYQIEPVADQELFVGREGEYARLLDSYANWESGRMATAVIIGEKWSGLTSFLNFVEFNHPFNQMVKRITTNEHSGETADLVARFRLVLGDNTLNSMEDIGAKLLTDNKQVIILENIQNLYLRTTGGFEVLRTLFELILKTSKNVFWITTCTSYTWAYFQEVLSTDEVFSYVIRLGVPTEKEVTRIVEKRNRISGYKILFEPSPEDLKSKKFQKLKEEDQQQYLKANFFKKLVNYSDGNISMALMYWLQSTKKVDESQIIIGSFEEPDLRFLAALPLNKVLMLHQLIIHDGLNAQQFGQVLRTSERSAYMTLSMMLEDGLLIYKNEQYMVNTLIYRSVINLLKAKNLIY